MSEKNYLNNLRIQSLGYIIIHEAEEEVNQRRNNALKTAAIGAGAGLAGGAYAASPHGQNMIRRVGQGISNMARPTNQPNIQTQQGAANQQNATTAAATNAANQAGNNAQNTGGAIPQDATSAIPNQVEWYRGRDILSSGANANRTLTNTAWGQNLKPQQPTAQPQTNQQTQQPQQNTTQPNQAQPVQQPVQQAAQPTNQAQPAQPTQQPVQPAPQQPQATPVTPERPVQYALPGQPQQPNWMPNQSTPDVERQFNQAAADLNNRTNATPNVGNVNAGGNSASGTVKDVTLDPNTPVPNNVSYTPSYVPPSLETSTTFNRSMPSPFGPKTSDSVQLGREADTINAPNLNIGLGNKQGVFDQTFRQDGQPTGYLDTARNSGINTPNPVAAPKPTEDPSVWDRVRGWFSSDKDDASQDTPTSDGEQSFLDKVYGGLADGYKRLTDGISKLNTPPDASYTPPKIDSDDYV